MQPIFANKIIRQSTECEQIKLSSVDINVVDLSDTNSVEISISQSAFAQNDKIKYIDVVVQSNQNCSIYNWMLKKFSL